MSRDIVRPVVVLTLICVIAAASVVGTEALTTPLIAERKATEEVETMRRLMPAADHFETDEHDGKKIYRAFDGDKLAGAAIIVEEGGYHDVVRIAVAVGVTGKVMGVSILQQDETPGLGSRITDGGFLAQFTGKSSADAVRVGADVQAIAGATISSSALARGVRSALETYRVAIAGEMAPGGGRYCRSARWDLPRQRRGLPRAHRGRCRDRRRTDNAGSHRGTDGNAVRVPAGA